MSQPENWTTWLQAPFLILLTLGAALEWYTIGYGGLLVAATGVVIAFCLQYKKSKIQEIKLTHYRKLR